MMRHLLERDRSNQTNTESVRVGDMVRFNGNIRPKYMIGQTGKITKLNGKSVRVWIGEDGGPFQESRGALPPLSFRSNRKSLNLSRCVAKPLGEIRGVFF